MSDEKETKREPSDVKLEDFVNAPLQATGADIPEGSYPATLFGFNAPFKMAVAERFRKPGQPDKRTVFELRFGIYDKSGNVAEQDLMVNVPSEGEVNRKSKLFKAIEALANGDAKFIEGNNIAKGVKLTSLIGRNVVLGIKKNDKDWPQIETVARRMEGAKYPTTEECKTLTGSDEVPF